MRLSVVFFVVFSMGGIGANWSEVANPLMRVWYKFLPHAPESSESPASKAVECVGCAQNKVTVREIKHDPFLTELRVEYVKQQILKKLRLSKPPEVSMPLSTLPKPLISNVLELRPGAPPEPERPAENFYGKTDQIVVFPNEGTVWRNVRNNRRLFSAIPSAVIGSFGHLGEIARLEIIDAESTFSYAVIRSVSFTVTSN